MTESITSINMRSYQKLFLLFIFTFTSAMLLAQAPEACNDGLDNDGDGLIDCFDSDCATSGDCDDSFFGNSVACFDEVSVINFGIRQQWGSPDRSAASHGTPAVGDLDLNGIPEVIVTNSLTNQVTVLSGFDGTILFQKDVQFSPENAPVIANVNGGETSEILVTQDKGDKLRLMDHQLNDVWSGGIKFASRSNIGLPGVADFDGDGDVEIYYKNEIMDATTGNILVAGDGNWQTDYTHGSLALDVLPDAFCTDCAGLELITGNEIWAINETAGTRTLAKDMDDDITDPTRHYYPKYYSLWEDQWSAVSAADYNLDGNVDILMTGALGTTTQQYNGTTTIFFWDVTNSTVTTYHDPSNDFVRGAGRINIGDVDGDGLLNANFVMNQKLYSLDENFDVHWIKGIPEGTSGFAGCSIFDFDGNGKMEIVYRSEQSVLIINGADGTTRKELACVSRTQEEYPVIADVDGDGASEICVTCYFNDATPFNPYTNSQFSHVRLYESDGEAWMPARSVWNQHGYFNVNINDDLTVPRQIQDHWVEFSDGVCQYSDGSTIPFPSRSLNSFISQAPVLDKDGCVKFVSPDMVILGNTISATRVQCPFAGIDVTFTLSNQGDADISGRLPVSYYAGDPTKAGSIHLDTEVETLANFTVGEEQEITQTIEGIGGVDTLYIVVNDLGSAPPITTTPGDYSSLPSATIPECETANNYNKIAVDFTPFALTVNKLQDNLKCDLTKPDNGIAQAYYQGSTPGSIETIYLENFEDLSNGVDSDTGSSAWTSNPGSQSPSYRGVDNYNGSKMFRAAFTGIRLDVGEVTWTSQTIDISNHANVNASVDVFENGGLESSGELRDFYKVYYSIDGGANVLLSNGSSYGNFAYKQATVTALNGNLLTITVQIHNTSASENHYIDNVLVTGTGSVVTKQHTEPDGFVFRWYNNDDFSTVLYTGSTHIGMATGTYDVVGYYASTQCYSDTVEVTINDVAPPVNVRVYEVAQLNDCATPDGSLGTFVYTTTDNGDGNFDTLLTADGYEFTWFITSEGVTPIATGDIVGQLDAISYTVEAAENYTGCGGSSSLTVSSTLTIPPQPTVSITNISTCEGNGTLSASVGGNSSDYTFQWFDGSSIKPVVDFTGSVYTVTLAGDYTVRAIENTSSCPSNSVTSTMVDDSSNPTATITVEANNTSCVSNNGIISADGDGAGTFNGFTFEWFLGSGTASGSALPGTALPSAFLVNDETFRLGGLAEGIYTVRVTNDATDCSILRETSVIISNPPSLIPKPGGLVTNGILGCDPNALGSVDASGLFPDTGSISIGNINGDFELPLVPVGDFSFLDEGRVPGWVTTATDDIIEIWSSGFRSVPSHSGNQHAEINAYQNAALYFDLSTVPGSLLNWSFAHRGRAGPDEISVNIGPPDAEIRQEKFITDTISWMVYEGEYTIPDNQFTTRFQFEAVSTAGGVITVGNFVDDVSFVLFPYRFDLYRGTNTSGTADFTNVSGIFPDLEEGDYTLVVYDNLTTCPSSTIPIAISRIEGNHVITTNLIHDTNCDTGSGSIAVTSSRVEGEPSAYTYRLYDGHSFISQIGGDVNVTNGATGNTFSSLEQGDYRVQVVNNDLQCSTFEDVVINNANVNPTFTVPQINDNTSCDPATPNGFISVNISGDPTDNYNFSWFKGTSITAPPLASGGGIHFQSNLDMGFYTVFAKHTTTGCESELLTLVVNDSPFVPNIVIEESAPQTNCTIGNGSLRAYVTSDPNSPGCTECTMNYTFQWSLDGAVLTDGVTASNGSVPTGAATNIVSGLIGNDSYAVEVAHNDLSCTTSKSFILSESLDYPILSLDNSRDNTTCDPRNYTGSITVQIALRTIPVPDLSGYTFTWYNGSGASKTLNTSSTSQTLSGISGGTYSVVSSRAPNTCRSDTVVYSIADALPTISSVPSGNTANTVCDATNNNAGADDSNGLITFTPTTSSGDPAGGYIFALSVEGVTINNAGLSTGFTDVAYDITAPAATPLVVRGLPANNYIMTITDADNTCFDEVAFSIGNDFTQLPVISRGDIRVTPNSTCDPVAFNGQADASVAVTGGSGTYRYEWAATTAPSMVIDSDNTLDLGGTGVEEGIYILTVIDDLTGCVSASVDVTIGQSKPIPLLTSTVLSDNFSCDVLTPNGRAEVQVSGGNAGHSFEWYTGVSAIGIIIDTDNQIEDRLHGTYTVKVTHIATQCFSTAQVTIREFTPSFTITATKIQDHTSCVPANGIAEVTGLNPPIFNPPSPSPIGFATTPVFTFTWHFGIGTTTPLVDGMDPGNGSAPDGVDNPRVEGLAAGQYTVVVTETRTGCLSSSETVTIDDMVSMNRPTITFVNEVIPSDCAAENGRITAEITALNGGGTNFSFEWFEGTQDFAGLHTTGSGNELNTGDFLVANPSPGNSVNVTQTTGGLGATTTLDRVVSGLYTLVMIDGTTNCRYQEVHELGFLGQQTTTTLTIDHVDECPDNGTARVGLADNIIIDVSGKMGTFTTKEPYTTSAGITGFINADNGTEIQLSVSSAMMLTTTEIITGTSSGATATIDVINSVGYTTGEVDDIAEYILYLYAGSGVPADRFTAYTYQGQTFPFSYDAATGTIRDGNGSTTALLGTPLSASEEAEFSGLPAGPYVAIAREIINPVFNPSSTNQCWTEASLDEQILDLARAPIVDEFTNTPNTNCGGTGNGQLSLTVAEDPIENMNPSTNQQPDGYRFTWVRDIDNIAVHTEDIVTESATSTTSDDLEPGSYTVTVDRLGAPLGAPNGCEVVQNFMVGNNPAQHLITGATVSPSDDCDPLDGSIVVNDADITENTADYRFTWYTSYTDPGTNTLLADALVDVGNNGDVGVNSVSSLAGGTYFVQATHVVSDCQTSVLEVEVADNRTDPIVQITSTLDDTSCDDATPTGSANVNVIMGGVAQTATDFVFNWFASDGATQLVRIPYDNLAVSTFSDGETINIGSETAVVVSDDETIIIASGLSGTVSDNDMISGSMSGTTALVDNTQDITVTGSVGVNTFSPATNGTYFVRVTDNATPDLGCFNSPDIEVTINQFDPTYFVGTIAATDFNITHIDDCDPLNGAYSILRVTETQRNGSTTTATPLSDFVFTWYSDVALITLIPDANVTGGTNGVAGASGVTDLDAGTYYVTISSVSTGCPSTGNQVHTFTLDDNKGVLAITRAGSSEDTYCDNAGFAGDGSLTVAIMEDGATAVPSDYAVGWYRGAFAVDPGTGNSNFLHDNRSSPSGANVGTAATGVDIRTLQGLSTGDYTVFITKNAGASPNSGCTAFTVLSVDRMSDIPVLNSEAVRARVAPDTLCMVGRNSGTIILNDSDFSTGDLTDFNIEIRRGSATGTHVGTSPYNTTPLTSITIEELEPDDYYILATHDVKGCVVATTILNVADLVHDPTIILVSISPDENCGSSAQTGAVEVVIDSKYTHANPFITVEWVDAVTGSPVMGVTNNEVTLTGVAGGEYQVNVTNTNTGCTASATYLIPDQRVDPSILNYTITGQTVCSPNNGSFELEESVFEGTTLDQTQMAANNFTLLVHDGPDPSTDSPVTDGNTGTPYIFEDMGFGTYYAFVRKDASQCISGGVQFTIEDQSTNPGIVITLQAVDETCATGAVPNGMLRALADGVTNAHSDYNFQWYQGSATSYMGGTAIMLTEGGDAASNGSTSVGVTTSNISGLAADTYTVEVTQLTTNCVSVDDFVMPNIPAVVAIMKADTVPSTSCSGNGSITVASVNKGNLTDYSFAYYDTDPTVGSPTPVFVGTSGAAYTIVLPGTYYIIGTNTVLNCITTPYRAIVRSNLTFPAISNDPDISLNQDNCDPDNPNGIYSILVNGAVPDPSIYSSQWYLGSDTSTPLTDALIGGNGTLSGETTATVSGIPAGTYTVGVQEIITGCTSVQTFSLDNVPRQNVLRVTTTANPNCVDPSGVMSVQVIGNSQPGNFDYYWFNGTVTNPDTTMAIFTKTKVTKRENGMYTVVVVEKSDRYCKSIETFEIGDGRRTPAYTLQIVNHQTVCFADKNDGFAMVTDYNKSEISIEWRNQTTNALLSTTTFVDSLAAGFYRITLTNKITGCVGTQIFQIHNIAETPANPTVVVNNHRTDCSQANGHAIANVSGVQNNFLLEWFNSTDLTTPYATGSEVFNLDSVAYLVRATNIVTGCMSAITPVHIRYEITNPEFRVVVDNSICLRTEDGSTNQFSGTATVLFTEFNQVRSYSWKDETGVERSTDSRLIDAHPGNWTVTLITENGCEHTASFVVQTAIQVYNGLSVNDDGKNDFLLIDCIDHFPGNNVKIFNRTGVRIYEVDGYDNGGIRFEGISNAGGGSLRLPEGTYFYVIDKGTGEDLVQGYLELVR